MLQKEISKNSVKRVSVWGAGGFGSVVHLFYDLPAKKISFYVDSDPKNKNEISDIQCINF